MTGKIRQRKYKARDLILYHSLCVGKSVRAVLGLDSRAGSSEKQQQQQQHQEAAEGMAAINDGARWPCQSTHPPLGLVWTGLPRHTGTVSQQRQRDVSCMLCWGRDLVMCDRSPACVTLHIAACPGSPPRCCDWNEAGGKVNQGLGRAWQEIGLTGE
jgi:hypothetical protein